MQYDAIRRCVSQHAHRCRVCIDIAWYHAVYIGAVAVDAWRNHHHPFILLSADSSVHITALILFADQGAFYPLSIAGVSEETKPACDANLVVHLSILSLRRRFGISSAIEEPRNHTSRRRSKPRIS